MSLGFTEIIRSIEAEIKTEYLSGAIHWCDKNFENAWSNAINRFDSALSLAIERKDFRTAELEGKFYKATVLDLLGKYKQHKNIDETNSFLEGISPLLPRK